MKVSIITPSYNQVDFIERTIQSVLTQDVDLEYIVIDGDSDDGTLKILEKYNGRLIWTSAKDKGQSDAVNKGLEMSSGEIIGWLNSDDIYLPGALKKAVKYFEENPECKWLYGRCKIIDQNDNEIRNFVTRYKNFISGKFCYSRLLIENFISQPAVFFRREIFQELVFASLDHHYAMDYELWLRLGKKYSPGVVPDYLACFRRHLYSKSESGYVKQFSEEYQIAKENTRNPFLLLLHKLNVFKIVAVYWLLGMKSEKRKNDIR
ncbi:MAG: glycosyltransferase, partial [Bacteroidales bacterium]|nr:glycosyltransferase [Bacteroidales bacterium]